MSDYDRPQKRSKIFRACESCVVSKTRCDDVTPLGCLICRKRQRPCSLAEVAIVPPPLSHLDDPTHQRPYNLAEINEELQLRLQAVESRAWDLEQRMRQMESQSVSQISPAIVTAPGSAPAQSQPQSTSASRKVPDIDIRVTKYLRQIYLTRFEERAFWPTNSEGYPDVVQRGIMTQDQVDMAFQLFKHRFSAFLPFAPFLLSSTPTPSHPFIILAILTHVPLADSQAIFTLVEEAILHAMTGAVEEEVVLALLILALQPVQPEQACGPSSLRVISLAHQLGASLGLEAKTKATLRRGKLMCSDDAWSSRLEEALLWEAVKLQYNLMHITFTRAGELLHSNANKLPEQHPLSHFREAIQHLKAGAELIDSFRKVALALDEAEAEMIYDMPDLEIIMTELQAVDQFLVAWRPRHPTWEPNVRTIAFTLNLRTTILIHTIPKPIVHTFEYAFGRHNIVREMVQCINFWAQWNEPLPAYIVFALIVSIGSGHRAGTQMLARNPNNKDLNRGVISTAEKKVYDIGGLPAMALRKIMGVVETDAMSETIGGLDSSLFDPNDPSNFFNFDFSTWDSLFGPGQSGIVT